MHLFQGRFFGREEGGTNVRQVWVEVRTLQATHLAQAHSCREALEASDGLTAPVQGLAFTQDGLAAFADSARISYLIGEVYSTCGKAERATKKFTRATKSAGRWELVWSWAAAHKLPNFDAKNWNDRLLTAGEEEKLACASLQQSSRCYNAGL